jgi:hypothetical protein
MPRWTFFDTAGEIELFERHDLNPEQLGHAEKLERARPILNRLVADHENRHTLIAVARHLGDLHVDSRFVDSNELHDIFSRALRGGRLVLLRGHHHPIPGGGGHNKKEEPPEPPPPGPAPKPPRPAKTSWVEIAFLCEDRSPAAGEHYQLQLPDGSLREGTVPKSGIVRIEKIDPGNCKLFMPDLQGSEWSA